MRGEGLRWIALSLVACTSTSSSQQAPRERDVLIEAFPGGTIVYQDGDGPWQLAPRVGDRYGFDVASDRYAVALVDVESRRVDSVYATLEERRDIAWHRVKSPALSGHVVSGMIDGLGDGGLVAGRFHSQTLPQAASQNFALEVADGPQAIVFARNDFVPEVSFRRAFDSLIVLRDVVIAGDVTDDADFAIQGHATLSIPVNLRNAGNSDACDVISTFSFGDTTVELAITQSRIFAPSVDQWRGGDRLATTMSCTASNGSVRSIARNDTVRETIKADFEFPPALLFADLLLEEGRFRFSWILDAPSPDRSFRLIAGRRACEGCPSWSSEITKGWSLEKSTIIKTISGPDLEALGLWDPTLQVAADAGWSVAAISSDGDAELTAGWVGSLPQ